MLVGKFPVKAQKILDAIRNEVKRPGMRNIIWDEEIEVLRWRWKDGDYCPMGMLKCALDPCPQYTIHFEGMRFTQNQIELFANWFDSEIDKVAVVDFIWGS